MDELTQGPRIADVVIVVMIIEAVALLMFRRGIGKMSAAGIAAMLLPGLFLVLALRASLAGNGWQAVAVFLCWRWWRISPIYGAGIAARETLAARSADETHHVIGR